MIQQPGGSRGDRAAARRRRSTPPEMKEGVAQGDADFHSMGGRASRRLCMPQRIEEPMPPSHRALIVVFTPISISSRSILSAFAPRTTTAHSTPQVLAASAAFWSMLFSPRRSNCFTVFPCRSGAAGGQDDDSDVVHDDARSSNCPLAVEFFDGHPDFRPAVNAAMTIAKRRLADAPRMTAWISATIAKAIS